MDFWSPSAGLDMALSGLPSSGFAYEIDEMDTTDTFSHDMRFDNEQILPSDGPTMSPANMLPIPHSNAQDNQEPDGTLDTMRATSMGPPVRLRKMKAPTLRENDWEPYKARIVELHVEQGLPLPDVRQIIKKEFGFTAELRQYRTRVSKWNLDKNIKPREMRAIVRKRLKRKLVEVNKGDLIFEVRGNPVEPQKIERWMKRHNVVDSMPYAPSPASTPSAIGCHTISDRGSPALGSLQSPALSTTSLGNPPLTVHGPRTPSPALSISSIVQLQASSFEGQSPSLSYQALPTAPLINMHTVLGSHYQVVTNAGHLPRGYLQDEEERLRDQLYKAETNPESDPEETLDMLLELGWILRDQGRYKAAEDIARRLVEGRRSQSGNDDVKTLIALSFLGSVLSDQGQYDKAERLCRRAFEELKKTLGPEHLDTLTYAHELGYVLIRSGKYTEAEVLFRRVKESSARVQGVEHHATLEATRFLGVVLSYQGKPTEAEALQRDVVEVRTRISGEDHIDTLMSILSLGEVLLRQARHAEAETMFRRAVDGFEKVLGPEHVYTLNALYFLAYVLNMQQQYSVAIPLYQRSYSGLVKAVGAQHPFTQNCLKNYRICQASSGLTN